MGIDYEGTSYDDFYGIIPSANINRPPAATGKARRRGLDALPFRRSPGQGKLATGSLEQCLDIVMRESGQIPFTNGFDSPSG
ncbi:hypothetical protein [Tropicimonas isoalkanivorans]|uniref:Uncharacterized protein n=1 Tax=Tropicimonas isoalkanivorans TaxID=441112 RepID=A0A1I1MNV5_9RHOB|nr:hypothetical protein [Tropicimonas isoalkanivorans]SFC87154.1 hypothetical protein SAMN04488094_110135 [Tropicimonas isoalkanivorans]